MKYLLVSIIIFSFSFNSEVERYISLVMKDSININSIPMEELSNNYADIPEFLFLEALIDTDGEKSLQNFESFSKTYPTNKYVDYSISEVGEYYYTKGYYVKSAEWFKKIPMYYHSSKELEKSINMFFSSMRVSGFLDSLGYYSDIFETLYPHIRIPEENLSINFNFESEIEYITKYTIQLGVFEDYNGAESMKYMLISGGFNPTIEKTTIDGKRLYVIRQGEFSSKKSAEKIASRIRARLGIETIISEL